ncbi:hypothetical protein [Marinobacter similis]|uniref:Uncharacterized protein n=1 Tax=Marinobacter similis TaxID=1420916 RepID=W5YLX1_9GAMM|nr:hypothetical protein [Marinobacter similis]AHI30040.1 hypothetical protein AU14_06230 [Marinobacter similis]
MFALFFILPLALWGDLAWPTSAFVAMGVFAVLAGGWLGGFGGIGSENYRIRRFHKDIEAGKYLIMVDVPKADVERVEMLMERLHPEVALRGEGSSVNNPFAAADGRVHIMH